MSKQSSLDIFFFYMYLTQDLVIRLITRNTECKIELRFWDNSFWLGESIMIKSIRLMNWKSYEDSILYIDPLTIMIGTNSSGKSNVIDALIFLSRISNGIGIFQAISGDVALNALRGGIDWMCKKNTNTFSLEVIMEYEGIEYEYSITIEVGTAKALIIDEKLIQHGVRDARLFYTSLRDDKLLNIPTYFWTGKQGKGQNFDLSRNTSILFQSKSLHLKKKEIVDVATNLLEE